MGILAIMVTLIAAIIIIYILIKWDAEELCIRVEFAFAGLGIDYKPTKWVCIFTAILINYLIFGIIIER